MPLSFAFTRSSRTTRYYSPSRRRTDENSPSLFSSLVSFALPLPLCFREPHEANLVENSHGGNRTRFRDFRTPNDSGDPGEIQKKDTCGKKCREKLSRRERDSVTVPKKNCDCGGEAEKYTNKNVVRKKKGISLTEEIEIRTKAVCRRKMVSAKFEHERAGLHLDSQEPLPR